MSEFKLTDREWHAFYIRDYFDFSRGNQNNMAKCASGKIPLVSAKKIDNGYKDFISDNNKPLFPENILTLNNDGDGGVGIAYYQPAISALDTHVTALLPKIEFSKYTLLFIARTITAQREKFSHGYSLNNSRLMAQKIMLPVNADGLPDWQFMEAVIRQKEQKQIAQLKSYYADKALDLMIQTGYLTDVNWKEFLFSEIFTKIQRGKRLTKSNQQDGLTPYVSSTAANNGVDNFIGNASGVRIFENCLTLANSGSVGSTFFHHYTFVASDHVTALILDKPNKYIYLFLSGLIRRLEEKYSFNREINDRRIQREKIMLPVNSDGEPDWQFMEDFMRQIEQDKIASVLSYYNNLLNNNKLSGGVEAWRPSENCWAAFVIQDICEILSGQDIYERERIKGNTPYVTATANNNGIGYFVANHNPTLEKNCISVNRNGSVGYAFYHPYPALFGNDTRKLRPKYPNKYVSLFVAACIEKQRNKYGYGYKMGTERLKKQKILLPITKDKQPDWESMERYMHHLELHQIMRYLQYR